MENIAIVTDTASNVSEELSAKYNIKVISLHVGYGVTCILKEKR